MIKKYFSFIFVLLFIVTTSCTFTTNNINKSTLSFNIKALTDKIENDAGLIYNGNWSLVNDINASGNNFHTTNVNSKIQQENTFIYSGNGWVNSTILGTNSRANNNSYERIITVYNTDVNIKYANGNSNWIHTGSGGLTESSSDGLPLVIENTNTSTLYNLVYKYNSGSNSQQWSTSMLGNWQTFGTYTYNRGDGTNSIEFNFYGTNIHIYQVQGPSRGICNIKIYDSLNNLVKDFTIDNYKPKWFNNIVSFKALKMGTYKVVITGNGKNPSSSDTVYDFDKALIYPSIEYTFNHTNIEIFSFSRNNCGNADISVDGINTQRLDLYNSFNILKSIRQIVGLTNTNHTLTIEATNQKNTLSSGNAINLNLLRMYPEVQGTFNGTELVIGGIKDSSYGQANLYIDNVGIDTNPNTPEVDLVDYYTSGPRTLSQVAYVTGLSNSSHKFSLLCKYKKNASSSGYVINIDYIATELPTVSYTFNTQGFYILGKAGNTQGKMIVEVTGLDPIVVDLYNSTNVYQDNLLQIGGLGNSTKTIKIRPAFEKNTLSTGYEINIDALVLISEPKINSVVPEMVSPNDTVYIVGNNFSNNNLENKVYFNGPDNNPIQATVISSEDTLIKAIVPTNAKTGKVAVETPGGYVISSNDIFIKKNIPSNIITNVSSTSSSSLNAKITVNSEGNPYIVWEDKSTSNNVTDNFYTQWDVTTWSNNLVNITNMSSSNINSLRPSIATDWAGNRHMVCVYGNTIYYAQSQNGIDWSYPLIVVASTSSTNVTPKISVSAKRIHVVWEELGEIIYTNSSSGSGWSTPENISNTSSTSRNPAIIGGPRDIPYIVWEEVNPSTGISKILYTRKVNGLWSTPFEVSQDSTKLAANPSISLDSLGNPYVVWERDVLGKRDIFFSRNLYRENTTNWTNPVNISNTATVNSYKPQIVTDGEGFSYVVWEEAASTTLPTSIFYTYQTNINSNTWSTPLRISTGNLISRNPSLSYDDADFSIHAVWESNNESPLYEIYHIKKNVIPPSKTVNRIAEIVTNKGTMKAILFENRLPITTSNFISLAQTGFYDNLTFHRYEPGFVIQGGDPTGTGFGGSPTTIPLEISKMVRFNFKGVLGMARTSNPDDASSQFFITLSNTSGFLNGDYSAFGKVFYGFDVLDNLRKDDYIITINIVNP